MARTPDDIENELLVLDCQDGDTQALRALYERWHPRLARLAWRLTGDLEAAGDILQDAWLSILRSIKRLDDPARFHVWAYRIVSNKCADRVRRRIVSRRAERDLLAESANRPCSVNLDSNEDMVAMLNALAKLPDDQHAVLSLHYLDGMSIADMAQALSVPRGTIKSRLHYARNQLRIAMERTDP